MFNFVNERLQEIMATKKPFGGISIVCIGDLFQLRPVLDGWVFKQPSKDLAILGPNIWKDHFKLFELTRIMRQRGDQTFAETLNRLREGVHTSQDVQLLKSRCLSTTHPDYQIDAPHILYYNDDVMKHNDRILLSAHTEKVVCKSFDVAIGDVSL